MEQLHKANSSLDQPPGHQALLAKRGSDRIVDSIQLARRFGLALQIDRLRCHRLHPERQFVRRCASRQLGAAWVLSGINIVQFAQELKACSLLLHGCTRWRLKVENWLVRWSKCRSLI